MCPPVGKALRGTKERQREQKQGPCDFPPRFSAAPGTRRKADSNERPDASRQKAGSLYRHRFGRPPSARRATAPERDKKAAFSFGPSTAHFLFHKTEKKMGWIGPAIIIAECLGGRLPLLHPSEGEPRREPVWGRPQPSHSPLCCSHHAGNAGSFGERVGVTSGAIRVMSPFSLLNGKRIAVSLFEPK